MTFNDIATQFYNAGSTYSTSIQPYAIKLFFALLLIDILVTCIQFVADGQLDAPHFLGRMIRHALSGGFVYLMIVNGFSWMNGVIASFSAIGAAVTGLPALNPQTVLQIGTSMASTIFNSPGNASMMTNFEQAIVQSVVAFMSYYRKLWIRCGDEKGGVPFRVGHANPGGSRVEGDATDAEGSGQRGGKGSRRATF